MQDAAVVKLFAVSFHDKANGTFVYFATGAGQSQELLVIAFLAEIKFCSVY